VRCPEVGEQSLNKKGDVVPKEGGGSVERSKPEQYEGIRGARIFFLVGKLGGKPLKQRRIRLGDGAQG